MIRFRYFIVAVLIAVVAMSSSKVVTEVSAVDLRPPVGDWDFCTAAQQIGCIEMFELVADDGSKREYTSRDQFTGQQDSPMISFGCSSLSADPTTCDPNATTSSNPAPISKCGVTEPARLYGTVTWGTRANRAFKVRIRTGNFDPAFSFGRGVEGMKRTVNSDGTFVLNWTGFIDEVNDWNMPAHLTTPPLAPNHLELLRDALNTAVATSVSHRASVQVFPRAYLRLGVYKPAGYECVDVPMSGMWAEANATLWEYSITFNGTVAKSAAVFKFGAKAPHYRFGSTGADDQFSPARIRMFVPTEYLEYSGHTLTSFDTKSLSITTSDGKQTTPTITKQSDGVLINFGIAHYSAPDPVVEIYNKGWVEPVVTPSVSVPASVVTSPAVVNVPQRTLAASTKKLTSSSKIASFARLKVPKGAKVSLVVGRSSLRVCRVVGTNVKALKKGTCSVRVVVKPKKGKIQSATVLLRVAK